MKVSKPKPCHICGCAVVHTFLYGDGWRCECQGDDCIMVGPIRETEQDAVDAWNLRQLRLDIRQTEAAMRELEWGMGICDCILNALNAKK